MTPKTTSQNLLYWAGALAVAVLLSFLSGIATHWPESGSIDWRGVVLDVVQTLLTTVPLVAAGFGLPRLGKEEVASLTSQVGTANATAALQDEAARQQGNDPAPLSDADIGRLADAVLKKRSAELQQRYPHAVPEVASRG